MKQLIFMASLLGLMMTTQLADAQSRGNRGGDRNEYRQDNGRRGGNGGSYTKGGNYGNGNSRASMHHRRMRAHHMHHRHMHAHRGYAARRPHRTHRGCF